MPTVIDSFVAEFTIEPSGIEGGAQKVRVNLKRIRDDVDKSGKDFDQFGKRAAAGLSKIRNEAIGLFLAFQGASSLKNFVGDVIAGDAATGRLAANLGIATNTVSAWQLAVQQAGGSAQDANSALSAMTAAYQSFIQTGTTGNDAVFRALLGPSWRPGEDPAETLLKLAKAAETMGKPRFASLAGQLGLSPAMITLLEQGRGGLEKLIEAKRLDGAASQADAEAAERFQAKLADLRNHVLREVRPALYTLVDGLDNLATHIDDAGEAAPALETALGGIAIAAAAAGSPFVALAAAIAAAVVAWKSFNTQVQTQQGRDQAIAQGFANPEFSLGKGTGGKTAGSYVMDWITGRSSPLDIFRSGGAPKAGQDAASTDFAASIAGGGNGGGRGTRAERNNNPGNIEDGAFARRQPGYVGGDGRFAKFASPEHGFAAMRTLLSGYMAQGRNTIASIIAKYAPSHENNTGAYAAAVERATGIGRNQPIGPGQLAAVTAAMARHEGYGRGTMARGVRGAAGGGGGSGGGPGHTTINGMTIHVATNDPNKVAAAIPAAIQRRQTTTQANRGMR